MLGDYKKHRFSIRKLTIGAVSLSLGLSLVQPTILNHNIVMASSASAETGLQGNVSTQQELQDKINNNEQNIILSANIDITKTITIPNTFTGKIHGNGFTLKLVTQNINMFLIKGSTVTFDSIVLDGAGIGRPIDIAEGANVTVTKSTIKNGHTGNQSNGGGIYVIGSKLKLDNTTIQDSKAVKKAGSAEDVRPNGGAIYAIASEVTVENKSEILNNTLVDGNGNGGGIHATGKSKVKISDSTFSGNHTFAIVDEANEGGAVFVNDGGTLEVSDSTFNVAKGFNTGGAIGIRHAKAEIKNSKFDINNLGDAYGISGGAIMSGESDLKVDGSTFTAANSKITFSGGFINIVTGGSFTLTNSTLTGAGSWWNGPSISTFGGAIGFETGSTATATIENTTIKDVTADETGGAISLATKINEEASVNLTLRNTNIINTRTKFAWKDTRGGAIHVGKGNTLRIDGGSIKNSFSVKGGAIYNDGTVELGGAETEISGNTAYKYGGGIYNNGTLLVDTANLTNNSKVSDGTAGAEENAGKTTEYAGANIYAKKDVTITPNAKFDEKDIRVLDQESSIILKGALKQKLNVSISEQPGGENNETPKRQVGYLVAKGDGTYTPTKEDAKLLHYFTRDTVGVSDYNDHDSLAKWDYVLNPENNTVVLGQRVKVVYDANADNAKFEDGNKTIEDVLTVYKPDFAPKETTKVPTRDGYRFNGWYTTSDNQNDKFTLSKNSFGITGNEITTPIAKESVTAYAAWLKEQKVTYEFESATAGKELPQAVKDLLPTDNTKYKKDDQVTAKQPAQTEVVDAAQDGKWKFKGYEPAGPVTVGTEDVKFVGKWEFIANEHNVMYEFESATAGKDLPQAVKDLKPTDANKYKKDQQVTATQPAQTEVEVAAEDGKWVFKGYEPASPVTVGTEDVKFVGKWEFVAKEHNATYKFESGTAGKELPQEVKDLLPTDAAKYKKGEQVNAKQPGQTQVTVADGKWEFKGYEPAGPVTMGDKDVEFVGKWEYKANPVAKYTVGYKFESETAGKELPQAVKDLLPTDADEYVNGDTVNAKQPAQTEVEDVAQDGKWVFKGYAANSQTVNGSNVEFVGKWEFVAKEHNATYKFESATAGKELPQEVKDLLPTDAAKYKKGEQVNAKQPGQTQVTVADGKWEFKGYEPAGPVTMGDKDVEFVGKWEYKANPVAKYTVGYKFESETAGKELPQAVKDLLPTDADEYVNGDTVDAKQPAKAEVEVADGKWVFKGYAANQQTVNGSNVEFVGKWEFVAKPVAKYKVTYEFTSTDASTALPAEVLALLPTDADEYVNGDTVNAKQPAQTEVTVANGKWTFNGYAANSQTVNGSDVKFSGTWTFTANPVTKYKATYEFKSADATKALPAEVLALLPTDANEYVDNDVVTATQPTKTEVTVSNGKWVFNGYDATTKTVNGAGVKFSGTWTFIENKYKATYRFESTTAGKVLPAEVTNLLPTDANEYVDNDVVTATQPTKTEVTVSNGKWVFNGYDATTKTVNGAGVKFSGTWTFIENKYKATYRFESTTAGKVLPAEVTNLLPTDANEYVDNDVVTATQPAKTEVTVASGKWVFKGYEAASQTVNGSNVEFVGKWEYVANKYKVSYKFESTTAGKTLPAEVTNLLPTDANEYVDNDVVTATQPAKTEVTVASGKWVFKGYAANSQTVNGSNVEFVGKWEYVANKYKVKYEFYSGTAGKDLPKSILRMLPSDSAEYVDGDEVVAKAPTAKTIETPEGVWTFAGYDKDKVVVNGAEVNFKGKWVFTPTKPTPPKLQQKPTKELPNTGETTTNAGLAGVTLAGLAALTAMRRRNKK